MNGSRPSFRFEALCELYSLDAESRRLALESIQKLQKSTTTTTTTTTTIKNVEDIIVNTTKHDDSPHKKQKLTRDHKQYFKVFENPYRWVATIVAKQQFCNKSTAFADLDTKSIRPVIVPALSAAEREFGNDRILFVTFVEITQMEYSTILKKMSKIRFGGQSFQLIGGKVNDKKSIRNDASTILTASSTDGFNDTKSFVAWYIAVEDAIDTRSSWLHCNCGHRGPTSPVHSLQEARAWYGQFESGTLPSKINARLQLAFTASYQSTLQISDSKVTVIKDVCPSSDKKMTDGCGFISVSKQFSLCYAICNHNSSSRIIY